MTQYKVLSNPLLSATKQHFKSSAHHPLDSDTPNEERVIPEDGLASIKQQFLQFLGRLCNDADITYNEERNTVTLPKKLGKVIDKLSEKTLEKLVRLIRNKSMGDHIKKEPLFKWLNLFQELNTKQIPKPIWSFETKTTQTNLLDEFLDKVINPASDLQITDSIFDEVKTLLTTTTPNETAWFLKHIEGTNFNSQNFELSAKSFRKFLHTVRSKIVVLPVPEQIMPKYDSIQDNFLQYCSFALNTASNPQEQAEYLFKLPLSPRISELASKGVKIFHKDILAPPPELTRETVLLNGCLVKDLASFASCQDHRLPLKAYLEYPNQLKQYLFSPNDCIGLTTIVALATTTSQAKGSITAFLNWAHQANKSNRELFEKIILLFSKEKATATLDQLSLAFQAVVELKEYQEHGIQLTDANVSSLSQLVTEIAKLKMQLHQKKFPEKPLEEVIQQFSTQNKTLEFPLSDAELSQVVQKYKEMIEIGNGLIHATTDSLTETITEIKSKKGNITPQDSLTIMAISRELIKRHFGIYPYNTQMLTLIALLNHPETAKGRIAQVGTGEGKSTLIAMLASHEAVLGKPVDIVTSNDYLATRDVELFKRFFADFRLQVSHNCTKEPQQENYSGDIVYGTNTHFEFDYLRDSIWDTRLRFSTQEGILQRRAFGVVIVDEVDNLILDRAQDSARLAIDGDQSQSEIYAPIYTIVDQSQQSKDTDLSYLLPTIKLCLAEMLTQEKLQRISDKKLLSLIEAAQHAKYALRKDRDYVVENNKVKLMEYQSTGKFSENSRLSGGIHEMLEAKEGIPPQSESLMVTAVSHPIFFNLYSKRYAVSGTCGILQERTEVKETYGLESFDVPSHLPKNRTDTPAHFIESPFNSDAFLNEVLTEIKKYQAQGRPLLLLCLSIEHSKHLALFLQRNGIKFKLSNETQDEKEEDIISVAGQPKAITVATNNAGRGTNILLSPDSITAGGLHSLFLFYPNNDRVEIQGRGRAGRQGQPGSSGILVSSNDEFIENMSGQSKTDFKAAKDDAAKREICQIQREIQQSQLSLKRLLHAEKERIEFEFQSEIFRLLQPWFESASVSEIQKFFSTKHLSVPIENAKTIKILLTNKLLQNWAQFFSSLSDIYHETIEEIQSNPMHLVTAMLTNPSLEAAILYRFRAKAVAQFEEVKQELIEKMKNPKELFSQLLSGELFRLR
jgi:preprotein translocase subunit SecA